MRRFAWILPFLLAAAILVESGRPTYPMGILLPHPLDRAVHALVFALLAILADRALQTLARHLPLYRRHLLILLAVSLFGFLDEWRQSFVPCRNADGWDWLADTLGGGLGLALASLPFVFTRRLGGAGWWRGTRVRPDPSRPLVLVADPHWGAALTGLEEATLAHPEADWLFLGDIFDVWVGLPGMEGPGQAAFLAWVKARRDAGRWVGLWMGNREFFLDSLSRHFDLLGEGVGGGLPGEGLAWEHGDLVNGADRKYRLWNLVSRSGPLWLLARLLPATTLRGLSLRLEAALRTTNRAYKLAFPREAFRAAAAERPDQTFITGHFHTHEVEGRAIALPWAHEGRFMAWRQGSVSPLEPRPPAPGIQVS